MVVTPNLFLNLFSFLVRRLVAILIATDGDATGDARESSHLIRYANWMWFFLIFSLSFYLYIHVSICMCKHLSLVIIVCELFFLFCYISA